MEKEFFSALQRHSQAKLAILNEYVIPWMRKIILGAHMFGGNGKCLVIDGFAGKGRYEDENEDGSPLILLKNAINFCEQAQKNKWTAPKIYLIFIEGDFKNYSDLLNNVEEIAGVRAESTLKGKFFFKAKDHPSIEIACVQDEFKNVIETLLDSVDSLIPSFCFIDPFGFSQTPFGLIKRFMKNNRAEILLNFIYEETNRFIFHKNEKIQQYICDHFGVEKLDELKQSIDESNNSDERKQIVVKYYSNQLQSEAKADYVLNFEIKKRGRTKLILFFATKSEVGLDVMKKAMWGQDSTGAYLFDDRNTIDQIEFEFVSNQLENEHIENLSDAIYSKFTGRNNVQKKQIDHYVVTKTIYPTGKLVTGALKTLEADGRIKSVRKIEEGKTRKPKTYKDVYIEFED